MIIKEIRKMSTDEMKQKIISLKKELFESKLNLNLVKLKDTSCIHKIKKLIKQIKTVIREREILEVNNLNENLKSKNSIILENESNEELK